MSLKTIAVLLTCHNRKEKTITCLKYLHYCTLPEGHVIDIFLVDDGSTDNTVETVKNNFPNINVIQGTGKLYWNRGMHLAWETATKTKDYNFYLWLNDDTYLFSNSLMILFENSKKNNFKSIIIGATCSTIGSTSYTGYNSKGEKIIPNGEIQKVETFNGNVVLVPRNVYIKIGILDNFYIHAIGDFDYALRAKANNIESYITTEHIAICEPNKNLPNWCLPEIKLRDRIKSLYSPLGNSHPYYYFIFEKRYYGIIRALKHLFTIHLRLLFPRLWN